jgi:catechol 2,3-dioxygenase-like lactoylglutathione lyase family enzyme
MEQPINFVINSLQHVGIPVTDIQQSAMFYSKLGFHNVMEAGFLIHKEPGTCIMMQRDNIIIELYQLPEPELTGIRNRLDGHVDHIAFDVPDIDHAFNVLKEGGYNVIEASPVFLQFWKNGCKYFNITGPDGERLEFNQVL